MKKYNQNLLWISITALALTACGGSSSSSNDDDSSDDHEHESSILVSQTGTDTLSLLEEGELEALDDAAADNGAAFVLSETGAYAAVLANGTVNFVHGLHDEEEEESEEEHEEEANVLDFSATGTQVITTGGHFAILDSGSTTFIEYDELENDTPATEGNDSGVIETYPALMIDEDHELVMVFDGTDAMFYEGTTEEASFACVNPTSHGQTDELVVVSCGATGVIAVVIEEESGEHSFEYSVLDLDGTDADYVWQAQGHVIVGFAPETTDYAIVELDESGATPEVVVVEGSNTDAVELSRNICDIQLDSEEQDVLVLVSGDGTTAGDKLVILDHEGEARNEGVTLNTSTDTDCGDLVMASASKNALVVDNSAQIAYDIDAHEADEGSVNYHVHSEYDLSSIGVDDIADVVIFHEKDEDADHDHDH